MEYAASSSQQPPDHRRSRPPIRRQRSDSELLSRSHSSGSEFFEVRTIRLLGTPLPRSLSHTPTLSRYSEFSESTVHEESVSPETKKEETTESESSPEHPPPARVGIGIRSKTPGPIRKNPSTSTSPAAESASTSSGPSSSRDDQPPAPKRQKEGSPKVAVVKPSQDEPPKEE